MDIHKESSLFKTYSNLIPERGYVVETREHLVKADGLPGSCVGEVVYFEKGGVGFVFTLLEDLIEILLLTKTTVQIGESVSRSGQPFQIANLSSFESKSISGLGESVNSEKANGYISVFASPQGIAKRAPVNKPFETGFQIIDLVVPLAKGQRELVLGDRKTGKSQILSSIIAHQAQMGTFCIYALVGKQASEIYNVESYFRQRGLREKICIVSTKSNDALGQIYLTPYIAMSIAEEMVRRGKEAVLVIDDMSTHAQFYREISLMARRFPGRSSYPGNIFYTHSSLMERAGNFLTDKGELSITCLPVAQSNLGDVTSYITTNLMSMTDGHIYLDSEIFDKGRRPAVNVFTSVTRVGLQTQSPLLKDVSRQISSFLVLYERALEYSHFGNEVSIDLQKTIEKGKVLYSIFDQKQHLSVPVAVSLYFVANLWGNKLTNTSSEYLKNGVAKLTEGYFSRLEIKSTIDTAVSSSDSLKDLIAKMPYFEIE